MGKIGKGILGKLIGSYKNCYRCPSIVLLFSGLDEEFEKYFSEDRTPENLDGEEVIQDLGR